MSKGKDWSSATDAERETADAAAKDMPPSNGNGHANGHAAADEAADAARRKARLEALRNNRVGAFMPEVIGRIRARAEGREKPIPLPWPTVADALRGGLWPGLHVLVGNTGSGKTQWALQAAVHAAEQAVPVLYVGLELDRLQINCRLVSLLAGAKPDSIPPKWSDLYTGHGSSHRGESCSAVQTLEAWKDRIAELPIHLAQGDSYGWRYDKLGELAADMRALYPERTTGERPFLLVLDFLQLVAGIDDREELRQRIARAAYAGRRAAVEHNCAVLLLSSTARENYGTLDSDDAKGNSGRKPTPLGQGNAARLVGLGKESGEVEFSADSVLVLGREAWEEGKPPEGGTGFYLAAAKVRANKTAWIRLRFDGNRFSEDMDKATHYVRLPDDE